MSGFNPCVPFEQPDQDVVGKIRDVVILGPPDLGLRCICTDPIGAKNVITSRRRHDGIEEIGLWVSGTIEKLDPDEEATIGPLDRFQDRM